MLHRFIFRNYLIIEYQRCTLLKRFQKTHLFRQCILIYVDINLNLTPTNITSYSTFIQIAKLYLLKVEKMQNPGECYIHLQRINMITRSYQLHSWLEKLRFFLLDVYVETFVWQQIRKFERKAHIVFENFALIYVYKLNFLQMSVHSV